MWLANFTLAKWAGSEVARQRVDAINEYSQFQYLLQVDVNF